MSKKTSKRTEEIMKSITDSDISMKPKHYYMGLTMLMIGAALAFIGLAALSLSLVSHDDLVGEDLEKLGIFATSSQKPALILTLLLIAVGVIGSVWILKKYRVGYRHRHAFLYIAVLTVMGLLAITSIQTGVAEDLSGKGPFSTLSPYSKEVREKHIGGVVLSIEEEIIIVQPKHFKEPIKIRLTETTEYREDTDIEVGDLVFVRGDKNNEGVVEAEIIIINPEDRNLRRFRPKYKVSEINPPHHL